MLRLAFDFIITWRETRTRPNAYGKGAYIGMGTMVVKPVTIGEGAIVGAGAIVTKDIPSNEVWAGNPARFIRKR